MKNLNGRRDFLRQSALAGTALVMSHSSSASGALAALAPQDKLVKVVPKETEELLANPHLGWQTFHAFADSDKQLAGLPSSSAYFRFYWSELEPKEGAADFAKLEGLLERARRAGQKLAFRVMCVGTAKDYLYVPQWLKDKGCPGFEYQYGGQGPKRWVPDMDAPLFQRRTSGSSRPSANATTARTTSTCSTSVRSACGANGT